MLDRTVRKGDLYETATGARIHAPRAGLSRKGEIISEASMVACLMDLGWKCKPPKGRTDATYVCSGKMADDSPP